MNHCDEEFGWSACVCPSGCVILGCGMLAVHLGPKRLMTAFRLVHPTHPVRRTASWLPWTDGGLDICSPNSHPQGRAWSRSRWP